jgi:hypothetical protein
MRIGLIVDGEAEFRSLPAFGQRVETPYTLVGVLRADIQPYAPTPQIVRAVKGRVPTLANRRADMIFVLIDRENRDVCPGQWASELAQALAAHYSDSGVRTFKVIIKNSCYENWLISDTTVFAQMPQRFQLSASDVNRIRPNKADTVDAQVIIKRSIQGRAYDKVADAIRIMSKANPLEMAANSRSFRKFLREIGHPRYQNQSRLP